MIKVPSLSSPERKAWMNDLSIRLRWLESLYLVLAVVLSIVAFRRHWWPWLAWFLVYQVVSSVVATVRCWRLAARQGRVP